MVRIEIAGVEDVLKYLRFVPCCSCQNKVKQHSNIYDDPHQHLNSLWKDKKKSTVKCLFLLRHSINVCFWSTRFCSRWGTVAATEEPRLGPQFTHKNSQKIATNTQTMVLSNGTEQAGNAGWWISRIVHTHTCRHTPGGPEDVWVRSLNLSFPLMTGNDNGGSSTAELRWHHICLLPVSIEGRL